MKQRLIWIVLGAYWLCGNSLGQEVRRPVWAGQFYPAQSQQLARQLDDLLANAEIPPQAQDQPVALIIPHAGYIYSGLVAAHAYRLIQGRDILTVVVVGVAHRYGFSGVSIYPRGGYATPLGVLRVDERLASELSRTSGFGFIARAHREEHSIEVQVPFIQKALPGAKLVPVLTGYPDRRNMDKLAQALAEVLPGKNALLVISSDFSHYLGKGKANSRDSETISWLLNQDIDRLASAVIRQDNRMCGGSGAVAALLYAARIGRPRVQLLKYADSAAAGGGADRVVGYAALAVYAEPRDEPFRLTPTEQQELLRIARSALEQKIRHNQILDPSSSSPNLNTPSGAFVTLKKQGQLRGCIGFIEPIAPLSKTVALAAVSAATRDHRFPPVSQGELASIEIEISVLTPPRRIQAPRQIQVGRHGLIISRGEHRGLLLPQVPVENNWDRRTFLEQACLKARLPRDAWKNGAEMYVFEALVFHEPSSRADQNRY